MRRLTPRCGSCVCASDDDRLTGAAYMCVVGEVANSLKCFRGVFSAGRARRVLLVPHDVFVGTATSPLSMSRRFAMLARTGMPLSIVLGCCVCTVSSHVLTARTSAALIGRQLPASWIMMASPAEERQQLINNLRTEKVEVTRQAQEAKARAYRERAAFEEKCKAAAKSVVPAAPTDAKAALNRLFTLDVDEVKVTQEVQASREEVLALTAEADAARFAEQLAELDEDIALLSGDEAAAEAARARADVAVAARLAADKAMPQSQRVQASALEKAAVAAALDAVVVQKRAAAARAEAEAEASVARAAVGLLAMDVSVETASYGFKEAGEKLYKRTFDTMYGDFDASMGMAFGPGPSEADEATKAADELRARQVAKSALKQSAETTRTQFEGDVAALLEEKEALLSELERKWREGEEGRALFTTFFESQEQTDARAKRAAITEAARSLGLAEPQSATEDDVARAEAARTAQRAADAQLVAEYAARHATGPDGAVELAAGSSGVSEFAGRGADEPKEPSEQQAKLIKLRATLSGLLEDGVPADALAPLDAQIAEVEMMMEAEQVERRRASDELAAAESVEDTSSGGVGDAAAASLAALGASADAWDAMVADRATEAEAAEAAAAEAALAVSTAMADVARAADANGEAAALDLELQVRELRELATAADAEATRAGERYLQAFREVQAGCSQAATIAITRAKAARAAAAEAENAAVEAVSAAAAAMKAAEEAGGTC